MRSISCICTLYLNTVVSKISSQAYKECTEDVCFMDPVFQIGKRLWQYRTATVFLAQLNIVE